MATTIKDTDLFITERGGSNYQLGAKAFKDAVGIFEPGTKVLFNNATAPVGWTNLASSATNNTALRIVKSGGGTTGGSGSFTGGFASHTIKAPKHSHSVSEGNHSHSATLASHGHSLTDPSHTHKTSSSGAVHQHLTPVVNSSNAADEAMFSMLGNRNMKNQPMHYSSTDNGDPSSAAAGRSGITAGAKNVSYTSGNNGGLGISVNNAGSTVTWDFRIKYNDFIICQKS